jgi:hypothetical protein
MSPLILLTRGSFREAVFSRDDFRCVVCGAPAEDAHHILERRLFADEGYYLDNGVSLCDQGGEGCHKKAEQTLISCEELRAAAGIERIVLPPHSKADEHYTKWGDVIMKDGRRSPGELFGDPSVQKVLAEAGLLSIYTPYLKQPRTPHLPWSEGRSGDDISLADVAAFAGQEVVVTAKLDGENTTLTNDRLYARSPDGIPHRSQAWVRQLHGHIGWEIPARWRVVGENVYAEHSIHYEGLPSYFFLFALWNERNSCLSWDETEEWASLLGLETVPVLYRGNWDEELVKSCHPRPVWASVAEGYVVRLAGEFSYADFRRSVAKYVRHDHVTTDRHWRHKPLTVNGLGSAETLATYFDRTKGEKQRSLRRLA